MCMRRLEALLSPLREGLSEGKHRPQWAPQKTPQVGMWAAHEGAPLVLRDSAPRFPRQGPPWGSEGEPGETKDFDLRRPSEANIEGDNVGHFGHHQMKPGRIKVPSAPQTLGHLPRAHTRHHSAALKPPAIFTLRPIERAHSWQRRRTRWQRGHLCQHEHVTPHHTHNMHDSNTSHASHIPSCASQIKPCFPSLHARCILFQFPNCVQNEGECQTHHIRVHMAMFAHAHSCLSCP